MRVDITSITDPAQKHSICDTILRALPDWFGNEAAIADYAEKVRDMPFFTAMDGDMPMGFAALKVHNAHTCEVCVMGVLEGYHRRGAGRLLIERCMEEARARGAGFLTVKTQGETRDDGGYARTRAFYRAMGFVPLEVFTEIWGEDCPCLFMAMWLGVNP